MQSSQAKTTAFDPWTDLLRQARAALASLRAEDLEELAGRAECMLEATTGNNGIRQRMHAPQKETLARLASEHSLLHNLLVETDRNLKVLHRMRLSAASDGEVDSRWVR